MEKINFEHYKSPYWSPEKGKDYQLVLANWREEFKSFDEGKTEKWVMIFDVLGINDEEYPIGKYVFTTGASSFAHDIEPIIERAQACGALAIYVALKYSKEKRYTIMDMGKINKIVDEAHVGIVEREEKRQAMIRGKTPKK